MTKLFPTTVIILFALASLVCFINGEVAKGLFYFFSAAINLTVLWM